MMESIKNSCTIKCYNGNATLFVRRDFYDITWDGLTNELSEGEFEEWLNEVLKPAEMCRPEDYRKVRETLAIAASDCIE